MAGMPRAAAELDASLLAATSHRAKRTIHSSCSAGPRASAAVVWFSCCSILTGAWVARGRQRWPAPRRRRPPRRGWSPARWRSPAGRPRRAQPGSLGTRSSSRSTPRRHAPPRRHRGRRSRTARARRSRSPAPATTTPTSASAATGARAPSSVPAAPSTAPPRSRVSSLTRPASAWPPRRESAAAGRTARGRAREGGDASRSDSRCTAPQLCHAFSTKKASAPRTARQGRGAGAERAQRRARRRLPARRRRRRARAAGCRGRRDGEADEDEHGLRPRPRPPQSAGGEAAAHHAGREGAVGQAHQRACRRGLAAHALGVDGDVDRPRCRAQDEQRGAQARRRGRERRGARLPRRRRRASRAAPARPSGRRVSPPGASQSRAPAPMHSSAIPSRPHRRPRRATAPRAGWRPTRPRRRRRQRSRPARVPAQPPVPPTHAGGSRRALTRAAGCCRPPSVARSSTS